MNTHIPSTDELATAPELAVLHALDAALAATQHALLAAHPPLEDEGLCGDGPIRLDGSGWIADAILLQISALNASLARYRQEIRRARHERFMTLPF